MKTTQRQLLLDTFRSEGHLYSYDITGELHIQQYNSRISDVRKQLGCTCINSKNRRTCTAREHIISDIDNHFIYKNTGGTTMPTVAKTNSDGYQKFKKMGAFLKNEAVKPDPQVEPVYDQLDKEELEALHAKAGAWLSNNENHPNFSKGLKRYEAICDALIGAELKDPDREWEHLTEDDRKWIDKNVKEE